MSFMHAILGKQDQSRKRFTDTGSSLVVAKGEGNGSVGPADAKCEFHSEGMGREVLLPISTGTYIQCPGINHDGRNAEKNATCVNLRHFVYSGNPLHIEIEYISI